MRLIRLVLALSFTLAPLAVEAQAVRTARVAFILPVPLSDVVGSKPAHPLVRAFIGELRDRGWVEGQNLILERRAAQGPSVGNIVRELVGLQCDVIVVTSSEMAHEARQVATTTPIVVWAIGNPVASGLAASLARPGGNITGVMTGVAPDVEAKRIDLLKEAVPTVSRMAIVEIRGMWEGGPGQRQRAAAAALGITLLHVNPMPHDYARTLDEISRQRADAVVFPPDPSLYSNVQRVVEFATENRLPTMARDRHLTEAGGLMSYGPNTGEYGRLLARYVDRILRGARAGDLPIEKPLRVELVINLKAAKALGLTIPQTLLLRADQVIE